MYCKRESYRFISVYCTSTKALLNTKYKHVLQRSTETSSNVDTIDMFV